MANFGETRADDFEYPLQSETRNHIFEINHELAQHNFMKMRIGKIKPEYLGEQIILRVDAKPVEQGRNWAESNDTSLGKQFFVHLFHFAQG